MSQVPRDERPTAADLEGYTESKFPPEEDLTDYRTELAIWLNDYWREQEEKRKREGDKGKPLLGHELMGDSGAGFDQENFDLGVLKGRIQTRGQR